MIEENLASYWGKPFFGHRFSGILPRIGLFSSLILVISKLAELDFLTKKLKKLAFFLSFAWNWAKK